MHHMKMVKNIFFKKKSTSSLIYIGSWNTVLFIVDIFYIPSLWTKTLEKGEIIQQNLPRRYISVVIYVWNILLQPISNLLFQFLGHYPQTKGFSESRINQARSRTRNSKFLWDRQRSSNRNRQGRIVQGGVADYGEWPWQVSLRQWRTCKFCLKK